MNLRNTTERTLHRFAVLNRFAAATTFLERSRGHEGRALRWIPGLVLIWQRLRAAGLDNGLSVPNQLGYTSIREPMITVRSRGRPKCSAASAVIWDVAMNRYLRHADIVGAVPTTSSMFDKK